MDYSSDNFKCNFCPEKKPKCPEIGQLLDVQLLCFANMLVARVLHSLVIASASNGAVACLHLVTENIIVILSNEEIDLIQ